MSDLNLENSNDTEPDYDGLLRGNLKHVFNERDAASRALAISELYSLSPIMYEPGGVVTGRSGISDVVDALLAQFGIDFSFNPNGKVLGHHGFGYLRWSAGPKNGPVAVTGVDIAEITDGRISRLWVLLDPPMPFS